MATHSLVRAREGKAGGGVGIFVKNSIKQKVSPHYSDKDIEIVWISVHRENQRPLHIGVYYWKQENANQEEIREEMDKLSEEIQEMKTTGKSILCMDANAKLGLMGEPMSRNGKLIEEVFEEYQLEVMNSAGICRGVITRQNRAREEEKSKASILFKYMKIDEVGEYRMRNKKESDHNTIMAEIQVMNEQANKGSNKLDWNFKAPPEKWQSF